MPMMPFFGKHFAYDAAMLFLSFVFQIFFREIRPRGSFHVPKDGPVIFVGAPHSNQFLDFILALEVYKETRRRVQFLIAASSMNVRVVGFLAKLMQSIPVARAQDLAKAGTGLIRLSPDDPCIVLGEGTKFKTELAPRKQIRLPKDVEAATAEVIEVISDTQLRVKREFAVDTGIRTVEICEKQAKILQESGAAGLTFKIIPHIEQHEMYQHVYKCIQDGGSIGIFPEGGSHDRPELLPLKAGVAIMALGAMVNNPNTQVKIVPVGLSYFHPHRFRSRAVVEFGPALDVPPELIELFKQGGAEKRKAIATLLDLIHDSLNTVTLQAPDYDTLMVVQAARRLYKTPGQHLTLGQVVELNRRLLEAYVHFKDEPRIQHLKIKILQYLDLVRALGLRDHQVPRARKASWKTLGLLLYRIILLAVVAVLALPGVILNGPIFISASIISKKKQKLALAASVVKIYARDVVGTWKVIISLVVAPILYGLYAFLAMVIAVRADAPLQLILLTPIVVAIALPFMNFAALKFGEAGMDILKSLPPLILGLLPGQQRSLARVKKMRVELANELADVINEFGPKLYGEEFEHWRMIIPSATAPPSGNSTGLWRRISSNGAVDAQGLALVHPMTWIDERLFGWKTGGSDDMAEEDSGDYDTVIRLIPGHENYGKMKSRNVSYTDLQKMK